MWQVFLADTSVYYMTTEKEEMDPYNGHAFCVALKSNRVTDLLETYTLDGTTRNVLSTSSMRPSYVGYLATRTVET